MAKTLALLLATPDWRVGLCHEIDTLEFKSAFDCFAGNAVLGFGVTYIAGPVAMQAFFVQIDSPLDIKHRILEVWSGGTTYVRGEAELATRDQPETQILAPFMWLFRRDRGGGPVVHWSVTAGPLATDKML